MKARTSTAKKVNKLIVTADKQVTPAKTAKQFLDKLSGFQTKAALANAQRFFRDESPENKFLGVRILNIFELAKQFTQLPLYDIEHLLESEFYEARLGAVSIMDFEARSKKVSVNRKKELYDLYIRRHDRINNWDLVDRSAPYVVGGYLFDKPRTTLYVLAKSKNVWERRTAIVSTYYFIRQNDVSDTFKIAEILVDDKHDLIHKAVGSWIREAGKRDQQKLLDFLDRHAAKMPKTMLRYAIEKLDKKLQDIYKKTSEKK